MEMPPYITKLPARTKFLHKVEHWFFRRIFEHIDYPEAATRDIKKLSQQGILVYVARAPSVWLYLYLRYAIRELSLPQVDVLAGLSLILWRPFRKLWEVILSKQKVPALPPGVSMDAAYNPEEVAYASAVSNGATSFLMLHPRSGPRKKRKRSPNDYLRVLLTLQNQLDKPIYILPHVLTDRAHSGMIEWSLTDRIFGSRRRPGALRALALRVTSPKTAFVRVAEPMNLMEVLRENPGHEFSKLARKISHSLNRRLTSEERVVAGPELPNHQITARHVLRTPSLREVIQQQAEAKKQSIQQVEHLAGQYIREIAARYHVNMLRFVDSAVSLILNRIYSGVYFDYQGFRKLLDAGRDGPLIFCPSHRSHVDYLALSHLLWRYGMVPPHIAAGINLSFFPLGTVFRGSGAFFLRRSFRNNVLYSTVFKAYIAELVRTGVSIEFFLEGTRTRTGKLLPPKFGILSMLLEAWTDGVQEDLTFVPVSIDYEKIIESKSYDKELKGKSKQKENLSGLIRTTSVLQSKFGRLHLQFGTPISLKHYATHKKVDQDSLRGNADRQRRFTQQLGYEILYGVSKVSTVTPTTIVATVILNHRGRSIAEGRLLAQARILLHYLDGCGARFSTPLAQESTRDAAILEAAKKLSDDGILKVDDIEKSRSEPIYYILEEQRVPMAFHKNTTINHFIPGSILARAILHESEPEVSLERVMEHSKVLNKLFRNEFVYSTTTTLEVAFEETVAAFSIRSFIDLSGPNESPMIVIKERETLEMLASFLDVFVEAYWATIKSLDILQEFPLWDKELKARCMEHCKRFYLEGLISRPEAANQTLVESCINWLAKTNVIVLKEEGRKKTVSLSPNYSAEALKSLCESVGQFL